MIKLEFFKEGSCVYILTNSGIKEFTVSGVSIKTQGDISITYLLSDKHNTRQSIRIESEYVFSDPDDILAMIIKQIESFTQDGSSENTET